MQAKAERSRAFVGSQIDECRDASGLIQQHHYSGNHRNTTADLPAFNYYTGSEETPLQFLNCPVVDILDIQRRRQYSSLHFHSNYNSSCSWRSTDQQTESKPITAVAQPNAWGTMPQSPSTSISEDRETMKSPPATGSLIDPTSLANMTRVNSKVNEATNSFSQILIEEKRQREEHAIAELRDFYNVGNLKDEIITIQRKPQPTPPPNFASWKRDFKLISNRALCSILRATNMTVHPSVTFGYTGRSAVHIAASVDRYTILEWLLNQGSIISGRDFESGSTPPHRAIFYGCIDCAVLLLRYGASWESLDVDTRSPLQQGLAMKILRKRLSYLQKNSNEEVICISTSHKHSLILTNCSLVFACGLNDEQQWGVNFQRSHNAKR
uniref:ANK_REP_REGION domain-containing protein n=1 Tax=Glossina austeni TaxID=7395 RepID=A0A1A9VU68_GLOAU